MNKKKIIVISGKQFSGKDTVANIIREFLPDFHRVALADAIKKEFGQERNLTVNEIEMNKPIYRADLIALGNKRRAEDPDYWIKQVLKEDGNIIVSDIRLKHELDIFKDAGAITIRIESDRAVRAKRGHLVAEEDPTETQLDKIKSWDYVIKNSGDMDALREQVKKIANEIEESIYSKK